MSAAREHSLGGMTGAQLRQRTRGCQGSDEPRVGWREGEDPASRGRVLPGEHHPLRGKTAR